MAKQPTNCVLKFLSLLRKSDRMLVPMIYAGYVQDTPDTWRYVVGVTRRHNDRNIIETHTIGGFVVSDEVITGKPERIPSDYARPFFLIHFDFEQAIDFFQNTKAFITISNMPLNETIEPIGNIVEWMMDFLEPISFLSFSEEVYADHPLFSLHGVKGYNSKEWVLDDCNYDYLQTFGHVKNKDSYNRFEVCWRAKKDDDSKENFWFITDGHRLAAVKSFDTKREFIGHNLNNVGTIDLGYLQNIKGRAYNTSGEGDGIWIHPSLTAVCGKLVTGDRFCFYNPEVYRDIENRVGSIYDSKPPSMQPLFKNSPSGGPIHYISLQAGDIDLFPRLTDWKGKTFKNLLFLIIVEDIDNKHLWHCHVCTKTIDIKHDKEELMNDSGLSHHSVHTFKKHISIDDIGYMTVDSYLWDRDYPSMLSTGQKYAVLTFDSSYIKQIITAFRRHNNRNYLLHLPLYTLKMSDKARMETMPVFFESPYCEDSVDSASYLLMRRRVDRVSPRVVEKIVKAFS